MVTQILGSLVGSYNEYGVRAVRRGLGDLLRARVQPRSSSRRRAKMTSPEEGDPACRRTPGRGRCYLPEQDLVPSVRSPLSVSFGTPIANQPPAGTPPAKGPRITLPIPLTVPGLSSCATKRSATPATSLVYAGACGRSKCQTAWRWLLSHGLMHASFSAVEALIEVPKGGAAPRAGGATAVEASSAALASGEARGACVRGGLADGPPRDGRVWHSSAFVPTCAVGAARWVAPWMKGS